MNVAEFKTEVSKIKESLRGLTLQVGTSNGSTPYQTLNDFGRAILNIEKSSQSIRIRQAWTNTGIIELSTLDQLQELLNTSAVIAVRFEAYHEAQTMTEYIKHNFGTHND